mgnify:CR=1 FL=1
MSVKTGITLSEKGIAELSERLGEPSWMRERRLAAYRAYEAMDLPKWDRTDVSGLSLENLVIYESGAPVDPSSAGGRLREIASAANGSAHLFIQAGSGRTWARLGEELAEKGVVVCDLQTAVREYEELFKEHFMSAVPHDVDKFVALHYAAVSSGCFIYVPKGVSVELPIEVRHFADEEGLCLFPHVLIVADRGSEVTVVEGTESIDGERSRVVSEVVELCPMEGAQIRFAAIQNWGRATYNFTLRRSVLPRDARVEWVTGDFGGFLSRTHSTSELVGSGCEATDLSVFFGDGSQHIDLGITMKHIGDHTSSDMVTKGVLAGSARSVYRGLTDIERGARFTSGFQRENTMLLSETARSDAIPGLEIDETEVQAGHAATVVQVDKVQLCYLMSRGLPRTEALKLIVTGFFDPVLQRVPVEGVRAELQAMIDGKMAG